MINNIRKFQDINLNEKEIKTQYYNNISNNNIEKAEKLIRDNELESKVVNAKNLNSISNTILTEEEKFDKETRVKLKELINKYNNKINDFTYLGEYDSYINYKATNIILYQNEIYVCIKENINILPYNEIYWKKLGLKGDVGYFPLGVNNKGYWSSTINYNKFDMVIYNNKLYISKIYNNINRNPNTDFNSWCLGNKVENAEIVVDREEPQTIGEKGIWIQIL